jgi:hypothetical protein
MEKEAKKLITNKQTENSNEQGSNYENFQLSECDKLDGEIKHIFDGLKLVGSPKNYSLDEVLEKAIIEEKEFTKWEQSGKPLENIRFFQNTNDKLKPLTVGRLSANKSFEENFKLEINENSQFEIWECNEDNSRQFPLYRILFSKIIGETKLIIREQLRKEFTLNIEVERKENSLCFKVSSCSSLLMFKESEKSTENLKPNSKVFGILSIFTVITLKKWIPAFQPQIIVLLMMITLSYHLLTKDDIKTDPSNLPAVEDSTTKSDSKAEVKLTPENGTDSPTPEMVVRKIINKETPLPKANKVSDKKFPKNASVKDLSESMAFNKSQPKSNGNYEVPQTKLLEEKFVALAKENAKKGEKKEISASGNIGDSREKTLFGSGSGCMVIPLSTNKCPRYS